MTQLQTPPPAPVDLLILGAGWTSQFLIPQLHSQNITFAATTTTGRTLDDEYHTPTIPFTFDPSSDSKRSFHALPRAEVVLITFPLKGEGQVGKLVGGYAGVHSGGDDDDDDDEDNGNNQKRERMARKFRWIQLGSTGIWSAGNNSGWVDRNSEYDKQNARAVAEDELLDLARTTKTGGRSNSNSESKDNIINDDKNDMTILAKEGKKEENEKAIHESVVLNLSGLHGGGRNPSNWISRVLKSKTDLAGKGSLHLIHGDDVALAVVGLTTLISESKNFQTWDRLKNQRWLLTDLHVYDWWDIVVAFKKRETGLAGSRESQGDDQTQWVQELMKSENVRALPRGMEKLGRCLDGREFWETLGMWPEKGGWRELE